MKLLSLKYKLIIGGVVSALLAGGFYYQSLQIHHFHSLYDGDETKIVLLNKTIDDMTFSQKSQTDKSNEAVIKVVAGPSQSIIKEVQSAPAFGACPVPKYPKEVTDAF